MKKILLFLLSIFPLFSFSEISYEKLGNFDLYEKVLKTDKNAVIIYASAWCPACQNFLKEYDKNKDKLEKGVKTYLIIFPYLFNQEDLKDYTKESLDYLKQKNYVYETYLDDEINIMEKYTIDSIPAVSIIKNGKDYGKFLNSNADVYKILKLFK